MASVSGTNVVESSNNNNNNNSSTNVPQWKIDLIQRRKQQNKVLTNNNGANTQLCTTTTTTTVSNNGVMANDASSMVKIIDSCTSKHEMTEGNMSSNRIDNNDTCDLVNRSVTGSASCTATTTTMTRESSSSSSSSSTLPLPLTTTSTATTSTTTIITKDTPDNVNESVACKMRFEADVSVCPSSEDTPKTTTTSTTTTLTKSLLSTNNITERNNLQDYNNFDSDYKDNIICHSKNNNNTMDNNKDSGGVCVYAEYKKGWDKTTTTLTSKIDDKIKNQNHHINNNHCIIDDNKKIKLIKKNGDECESDSSEELQYGPGIVNRLKSKYLNLTLREMNKSRVSVQRFRRAASLEDLLDCDDHDEDGGDDNDNNNDENDKLTRKFTKKPLIPGVINKTDRYRNATRGNESMKRARSVEALMRCQNHDDTNQNSRFIGVRQEPVNDHIVLIDRATVKIESRLIGNVIDNDRPKALNKPKRIKPLLADTERPPPDLVKTTMRIFEGSVRKLKLKGDVAAKVATFKTINDTFKAQTVKKIVPKPPIQPKPFTNNNNNNNININKQPSSPKKNISSQLSKPITAEIIENPLIHEEYRNDGVVTDPIIQSVSSVVSKFQQIGKSINSPSSSPEPIYNKLKSSLSPISSPEPPFINNNNNHNNHQSNNNNHNNHQSNNNNHHHKQKINNDVGTGFIKSISPVTSPSSPKKNLPRQNIILTQTASVSPVNELFRTNNNSTLESLVKAQPEILISEETVIEETDKQPENRRQQVLEEKILPPIIHDEIIEEKKKEEEVNKHVKELNEEIINKQDIIEDIIDDVEAIDGPKTISKSALDSISKAGCTMEFNFNTETSIKKSYLPGTMQNGNSNESTLNGNIEELKNNDKKLLISNDIAGNCGDDDDDNDNDNDNDNDDDIKTDKEKINETPIILDNIEMKKNDNEIIKPSIGAISSLGMIKSSSTKMSYSQINESKLIKNQKTDLPPQKQIGIIRPLVSTKTQSPQQNLSSRELEKNLINRVKSIEQPTKVVVSLKSADEIQPVKKNGSSGSGGGGGGGGLWDTKPWNQQNNTMVFNFSNRKDVPDYIENDGLIISRKREKSKVGDGGIIVLDATLDASTTDDNDWDNSEGPPSPCDIKFTNDNILINGRSNLSRSPRNHKHRIQFNDQATRTFEYPSESSMLEDIGSTSCVDGETFGVGDHQQSTQIANKSISSTVNSASVSPILGGGGFSNFTPSKVDLASEGFELGVTRTLGISSTSQSTPIRDGNKKINDEEAMNEEEDCSQNSQDTAAWGAEATADLLY